MADELTADLVADIDGDHHEGHVAAHRSPPPRRIWLAVLIALLSPIAGLLYAGAARLIWPFVAAQILMAVWLVAGWSASFAGFFGYLLLLIGQGLVGMAVAGIAAFRNPNPTSLAPYQRYWIYLVVIIAVGAGQRLAAMVEGPAVVGIESSSMFPTIWSSDLVLATGGQWSSYQPRRGDIVVYWHPRQPGERWIKRVVGLSGDHIDLRDGLLVINGKAVERQEAENLVWEPRPGMTLTFNRMRETWPDTLDDDARSFDTVNVSALVGDYHNRDNLVVPDGHVFVMGDYRDNSLDSRTGLHGPLPIDNITHRVVGILWSSRRELSMMPIYSSNSGKADR